MKNNLISALIKLVCTLLLSFNVHSSDDVNDSLLQDDNDIMLMDEFSSCTDQYEINDLESNNITSSLLLSGDAFFAPGDLIISSTNARAIVDSYDSSTNKLIYYQTAETGFKSFSLGEKLVGKGENVSIIEEFILDFGVPCSDLVVSIEESPEQMMFIFADSYEAIKAELAAQEMMAEIKVEMARQAGLDAFLQKLADEKAAAAASTAAYLDKLLFEELAAFEAQLEAELAAQEMMAEIKVEMARQAGLDAFLQKLADEKAAAAASTAAYLDKLLFEELAAFEAQLEAELAAQEMMAEIKVEMARQAGLDAFLQKLADEKAAAAASTAAYLDKLLFEELAAFEAQLEAELAAQEMMAEIKVEMARQAGLDAFLQKLADEKAAAAASTAAYLDKLLFEELAAFEAQLEAELAAQEMMAEIKVEMARQAGLDAFLQKLADEKAAAAASTAAYQAKLAYDMRVTKIMNDLIVQLDELGIVDDYKLTIKDELIKEATEKLEDEKFIGTISGEIVTVAIHDFCKVNLGLSDSNIELFKKALEGGYLGNVGPQVTNGTEFSLNRWDDYIECVGSKRI
ncbi:hypothetical protein [Candidatus Pseudothioglobus sp. Uisw_016]|uniref:hypothetical protein n=1 Tax=Candidatus Pseudothioglobus sp. Uisw_016 TaxID=3230995 RepID=UPI003A89067E